MLSTAGKGNYDNKILIVWPTASFPWVGEGVTFEPRFFRQTCIFGMNALTKDIFFLKSLAKSIFLKTPRKTIGIWG